MIKSTIRSAYTRCWITAMTVAGVLCGVTPVHAEDTPAPTGDPGSLDKLSFVLQLGFAIFIAVFAVRAGYAWVGYSKDKDPQSKSMKKEESIRYLKGLAYSVVGYIGLKMMLVVFGI